MDCGGAEERKKVSANQRWAGPEKGLSALPLFPEEERVRGRGGGVFFGVGSKIKWIRIEKKRKRNIFASSEKKARGAKDGGGGRKKEETKEERHRGGKTYAVRKKGTSHKKK